MFDYTTTKKYNNLNTFINTLSIKEANHFNEEQLELNEKAVFDFVEAYLRLKYKDATFMIINSHHWFDGELFRAIGFAFDRHILGSYFIDKITNEYSRYFEYQDWAQTDKYKAIKLTNKQFNPIETVVANNINTYSDVIIHNEFVFILLSCILDEIIQDGFIKNAKY